MSKSVLRCFYVFTCLCIAAVLLAEAKITIGAVNGAAGAEVLVPVSLEDAATDTTMVFLRLDYDDSILEEPTVIVKGTIASEEHTVELYVPEAGRVNILIDGGDDFAAFTGQNGEVAVITFQIKEGAGHQEAAAIDLTVEPILPKSGLVNTEGKNVAHSVQSGTVTRIADWHQY